MKKIIVIIIIIVSAFLFLGKESIQIDTACAQGACKPKTCSYSYQCGIYCVCYRPKYQNTGMCVGS